MSIMYFLSEKINGKEIPNRSKMKEDTFFADNNGDMELVQIPKMRNRAKHTTTN